MGARSSGREAALQMLFAVDTGQHDAKRVIDDFWIEFPGDVEGRAYADEIVTRICESLSNIDQTIRDTATKWRLERMTPVDRNILRIATYELLHRADVPYEVIIDEAVELAKSYGADQSSSFVNGVLDKMAHALRRSD
jgi:N utilization substance protein B